MAITKRSYDSRLLMLSDIEDNDVSKIIESIYIFNEDESNEPVQIILNSLGGNVYDGLGLIDVIDNSRIPIHIIAYGCVMSMGLIVFASGHERYCGKNTTFMYHESAYSVNGKIQDHKNDLAETERIEKICDDYLVANSNIKLDTLTKTKQSHRDWYFNAQEALKYGVVDKIL